MFFAAARDMPLILYSVARVAAAGSGVPYSRPSVRPPYSVYQPATDAPRRGTPATCGRHRLGSRRPELAGSTRPPCHPTCRAPLGLDLLT